jgi:CheY-like chemotaxis protein
VATRVLVVDDDAGIRESLEEALTDAGYEVVVAANGRQALGMLSPRPALMLIDLMMPELDGWELLDELGRSASLADIPVCVLSAIAKQAPPGAKAVLHKPIDLDVLLATVERLTKT